MSADRPGCLCLAHSVCAECTCDCNHDGPEGNCRWCGALAVTDECDECWALRTYDEQQVAS